MLFSVIYSADCSVDEKIGELAPPRCRAWHQTERGESEYEMFWGSEKLKDPWKASEAKGKHRKWCAILTRKQFDHFIKHVQIYPSQAMGGSLGAPGFGFGCTPAIVFADEGRPNAVVDAFVTPVPRRAYKHNRPVDDRAWDRLRRAVLAAYR